MIYVVYRPVLDDAADDAAQTEAFLDWQPEGVGWPMQTLDKAEPGDVLGRRIVRLAGSVREGGVLVVWGWKTFGSMQAIYEVLDELSKAERKKIAMPMWIELLSGGCFDLTGGQQSFQARMHAIIMMAKPEDYASPYHPRSLLAARYLAWRDQIQPTD